MMNKPIYPLLVILFAFVALFGCGNKEASAPIVEKQKQPEATEAKVPEKPPFTFAVSGDFKPLNYEENGTLMGFDVEIGFEIAKRLGLKPEPVKQDKKSLLSSLHQGKYQAVINSLSITPQREEEVSFTKPYYLTGAQLFVRKDKEDLTSMEQLKDSKIGVVENSPFQRIAQKQTKRMKGYPSTVDMLRALQSGEVDAVIMDKVTGLVAMKDEGIQMKPLGGLLYADEVAIAVGKDQTKLAEDINQALEAMIADGTYGKISSKWFGLDITK